MRESTKRNIIEEPQLTASTFQNWLLTWRMSVPLEPSRDVHEFLTHIQGLLKQLQKKWRRCTVWSCYLKQIYCSQWRSLYGQTQQMRIRSFFTKKEHSLFQIAEERSIGERWSKRRCGWGLKEIKYFYMYLAKYQPLRGETYIPTPKKASKRKTKSLPEYII